MKKIFLLFTLSPASYFAFAQLTVTNADGGSVVTKLGMGIKVNDGSSLTRQWIVINDASCPLQLNNVGIQTIYSAEEYRFKPDGNMTVKEPIVAYEIDHVLYDVFGEHIQTLANTTIVDLDRGDKDFDKYSSWYASENQIREYLICVSYVADVRTKNGSIWHYSYEALKDQLDKLKITFSKEYLPEKDKDNGADKKQ
jgi:hypothetical protein